MPRARHSPSKESRALIKNLAAVGVPQEQIALKIGIRSPKTLRKYYRAELDMGSIDANASVAGALYNKAIGGDTFAQKFWLENRAGWGRPAFYRTPTVPPPFVVSREVGAPAA